MAVDANVLINERIRQELQTGKNAKKALDVAFNKVFWTIVDANVTTLIAALVLLETNSSGPIRGFAITLMLGLIASLFTSLYCSKVFFSAVISKLGSDKQIRSWLGDGNLLTFRFNFLKGGSIATIVAVVLGLSVVGTGVVRGLNWGVDFAGGTEMILGFQKDVEVKEIRDLAQEAGLGNLTIQALEGGQKHYLLRFESVGTANSSGEASNAVMTKEFQKFKASFEQRLADRVPEILQVDFVGPQIGKELRTQGSLSVLYAILGVLVYIAFRFDMRFGPGAVIKMFLDIFVTMGFYVFFWRTFDLTSVAAILTIVGYSVNDMIVVYDRIRENIATNGRRSMFEIINLSLNETLVRGINTSLTTVLALVGVLIFGTGQIWNFAMAMTIGITVATLSSMFIASSFVLWTETFRNRKGQDKAISKSPKMAT
jgi:SecD/SecF fusion protein